MLKWFEDVWIFVQILTISERLKDTRSGPPVELSGAIRGIVGMTETNLDPVRINDTEAVV